MVKKSFLEERVYFLFNVLFSILDIHSLDRRLVDHAAVEVVDTLGAVAVDGLQDGFAIVERLF